MTARPRSHSFVVKETYQNGLVATALAGLVGQPVRPEIMEVIV
jgi:hypothetical protein